MKLRYKNQKHVRHSLRVSRKKEKRRKIVKKLNLIKERSKLGRKVKTKKKNRARKLSEVEFMDSQSCRIDGKEMIYMMSPHSLLNNIEKTLLKVGAKKFMSSPDENIKKTRESLAGLFFLLCLQSKTADSLFLMSPKQDPPDFFLLTLPDELEEMTIEPIELLEIPPRCKTFEEMMSIVEKKLKKGYSESYHLLIFINNENSKEWLPLFNKKLKDYSPFKSISTVHLLDNAGDFQPVANRLRPYPLIHIEPMLSKVTIPRKIPKYMEEFYFEGKSFIAFKEDKIKDFLKKVRVFKLRKTP